ncbi:Plant cysteine oxidase 2 [Nymphaea thermarum]|nr:Plant cysteine oxidase 2 [Nymphaea thermarum]
MLQRLYEACKNAFFGPGTIPSPQTIQQLRSILDQHAEVYARALFSKENQSSYAFRFSRADSMRASDLGLREDMPYFRVNVPESSPFVTIMPIYACYNFSICIFCLPPAAFIPLHNHPGMTVFSKLLFGSMHIKSYDWVTNIPNGSNPEGQPNFQGMASMASSVGPRLAKVHFDGIFTAESDTSVLYPTTGGNLHTFRAITACAVLDVLGPPYSEADGRDCTYYRSLPCPRASGEGALDARGVYELLEEIQMPDDFSFVPAPYRGPRIAESN